jgi:hypothetical protein
MQTLTVCRVETDWAVRDVTGEAYGRSPDIRHAYETARQMARRMGSQIKFTREAEDHYRSVVNAVHAASPEHVTLAPRQGWLRSLLAELGLIRP